MTIKKMLLLASMALAVVAFAAPAAAQANANWITGGNPIGDEDDPTTVSVHGELASKVGNFTTGPAVVHGHGLLWNSAASGMGEGEITSFTITGELPVQGQPDPRCQATGTTAELPWPVTATTPTEAGKPYEVDIDAHFTNDYNSFCQALGFPATATAAGTAVGTVSGNCLNFNSSGNMKTVPGGAPVALTGSVCITDEESEEGGEIGLE